MKQYSRIAVGIDLEPDGRRICVGSRRAARQARDLASRTGASIAFLHSTFRESEQLPPSYHKPGSRELSPEAWAVLESTSREFTDENIHTSLHFTTEPAWLELCRWASRDVADLVVVGKRSATAVDRRQIGTIATKLIRKCPVPVWLVHPDHKPGDGCVLAATDLSPVGIRVTQMAYYVSQLYDTKLEILHAHLLGGTHPSDSRADELEAEIRRDIIDSLGIDDDVQVRIARDSPSNAISAALADFTPNLLVMGSLSRTGRTGQLLGNTAERVFHHAECSLLTIKPEDFVSPVE